MPRSLLRGVHLPGVVRVGPVRRHAQPPPPGAAGHRGAVRAAPDHPQRARSARVPQVRPGPAAFAVRRHGAERAERGRRRAGRRRDGAARRRRQDARRRRPVAHGRSALHVQPDEEQRAQPARHAEQLLVQRLGHAELRMASRTQFTRCVRSNNSRVSGTRRRRTASRRRGSRRNAYD